MLLVYELKPKLNHLVFVKLRPSFPANTCSPRVISDSRCIELMHIYDTTAKFNVQLVHEREREREREREKERKREGLCQER